MRLYSAHRPIFDKAKKFGQTAPSNTPGYAMTIRAQDATSASTADNVALVQLHILVANDAMSSTTADNVVLI